MIKKGTWVNIRKIILEPKERAAGIPDDTKSVPLIMWVKGFLQDDANLGDDVTITTRMGRYESGILEAANPDIDVNYGDFVPEVLQIGSQAREILFGGENG